MASYSYDSSYAESVSDQCRKIAARLQVRIEDYTDIRKRLRYQPDETGGLEDSRAYLQTKINELSHKKKRFYFLKQSTERFAANVEAIDHRVAARIDKSADIFYANNNIKPQSHHWIHAIYTYFDEKADHFKTFIKNTLGHLWQGLKDIWDCVIQFYEDYKYWIDIGTDFLTMIVALTALTSTGSFIVIFPALWSLVKSTDELFNDSLALGYHLSGDDEKAEQYSDRTLKDDIVGIASSAAATFYGQEAGEFIAQSFGTLYDGADILALICDVTKSGKEIKEFFTHGKLSEKIPKINKEENGFTKNLFRVNKNMSQSDYQYTRDKLLAMKDSNRNGILTRASQTLRYQDAHMTFQTARMYKNTEKVLAIQKMFGTSDKISVAMNNGINYYKGIKSVVTTTNLVLNENIVEGIMSGKVTLTTPSKIVNMYTAFAAHTGKLLNKGEKFYSNIIVIPYREIKNELFI